MTQPQTFENYPCKIVLVSNLFSILTYVIGAYIIYQLGILWFVLYVLYILGLEIRLLKKSCTNCFYYGKFCAFGKGKLSALFFKKGSSDTFHNRKITWKDLIPDLLVSVAPIVVGIILLIQKFNWLIVLLLLALTVLSTVGNGFVRNTLACKFCKQKELGCPAEQLFNKK